MRITAICLVLLAVSGSQALAQTTDEAPRRPVVVVTSALPGPAPTPPRIQTLEPVTLERQTENPAIALPATPQPAIRPVKPNVALAFNQIKARIAEARRQFLSRPQPTALVESDINNIVVKIAFLDLRTRQIDTVSVTRSAFLTPYVGTFVISESGRQFTVRTIRANGVNTPVNIIDDAGNAQLPLLVQYPYIRNGRFTETAYYVSTHPGLITPEVVSAGQYYVRNTIDLARERLRQKGFSIDPKVADIAERLAAVEHVDHLRFRTETHSDIYDDIYTLFALNEGQTYRYAVSSAGAGGMVQMIPSTYRMVRSRFPSADLMPDFVEGMRDHINASQAMLLYMQMTWNDLRANAVVQNALAEGIATPEQLMSAGYNSNPAKLPGYISRGGSAWTVLIPRETQIYLQIYASLERNVSMSPRTR